MARFSLTTFLVVTLVGCAAPRRVIHQLPSPVMWAYAPKPKPPPTPPKPRPIGPVKIVIDAGHGGKDPGTRGVSRLPEKAINLAVSRELTRMLMERGARVVTTRTTDRFITLERRAAIARRTGADLFVSIHADWNKQRRTSGATIYISRNCSRQSIRAAECIVAALGAAGIKCNGIRRRNFRVLVRHSRPAVLIECGFLSNWLDAKRLNTPSHRAKIAEAITNGIARYFGK